MTTIKSVLRVKTAVLLACCTIGTNAQTPQVTVGEDGKVHIPAYDVPLSIFMSDEAKRIYTDLRLHWPPSAKMSSDLVKVRDALESSWLVPQLQAAKASYATTIEAKTIAGVRTDVVLPKGGIAKHNENRVVISLCGGGFVLGTDTLRLIEAIPIAATAKIKVISIDYRQSPEHKFPAATDDVVAVYKELLKQYPPQNIGIYGHSTGGTLGAMSLARLQKEKLPRPGAIAVVSMPGATVGGDSYYMAGPLSPLFGSRAPAPPVTVKPALTKMPYLADADVNDPLVSPLSHPKVLAGFPPTLIVTGTRDTFASALIDIHRQLVKAGVESQLELWEGTWHASIQHVDMPESKESFAVTAKFFARHLGQDRR